MKPRPEAVLLGWSGGKDSCLALHELRADPRWDVVALLTTVTENDRRVSMHGVPLELLEDQADAAGLPLQVVPVPAEPDNETYGRRMAKALGDARSEGIRTVAFGDLFLSDIREYREAMLSTVGMKAIFPLWNRPTSNLAEDFVALGYKALLCCVDTDQIAGSFTGRAFDHSLLNDIPPGADPCGENGEFHSFVYDGPVFSRPVKFAPGERFLRGNRFSYQELLPVAS